MVLYGLIFFIFSHSPSLIPSVHVKWKASERKWKKKLTRREPKALVSYCDCSANKKRNGRLCRIHTYMKWDGSVKRTGHHQTDELKQEREIKRKMPKEQIILCVKLDDDDSTIEHCLWNGKDKLCSAKDSHRIVGEIQFCCVSIRMCVCAHVKDNAIFAKEYRPPATVFEPNRDRASSPHSHHTATYTHTHTQSFYKLYSHFIVYSVHRMRQMTHITWCEIGRKCVRKIDGSKAR